MSFVKWVMAGSIGGAVGAAIWAAISYATNYEIGWIAWGIGGLVGFFVRAVAGEEEEGFGPGATAAVLAILAVLGGKYAAYAMLISSVGSIDVPVDVSDNTMIVAEADAIVEAREAQGQRVVFPAGKTVETAENAADYPPDIWQQAQKQWESLPAEQKEQKREAHRQEMAAIAALFDNLVAEQVPFSSQFSPFDALWFLLAAATGYRLGAGTWGSDDD
jgi:hypothetical protein